jgi:hypothetical protein
MERGSVNSKKTPLTDSEDDNAKVYYPSNSNSKKNPDDSVNSDIELSNPNLVTRSDASLQQTPTGLGGFASHVDIRATNGPISENDTVDERRTDASDDMVEIDANAPEFYVNFTNVKTISNAKPEDVFEWLCDPRSHNFKTDDFKLKTKETFKSERTSLPVMERKRLESVVGKDDYIEDAQFSRKLVNFFITDFRKKEGDEEEKSAGFFGCCARRKEPKKREAQFQVDVKMYKFGNPYEPEDAGKPESVEDINAGNEASRSRAVTIEPGSGAQPPVVEEKKEEAAPARRAKSNSLGSRKSNPKGKPAKKILKKRGSGDIWNIGKITYDAMPIMVNDEQAPPPPSSSSCFEAEVQIKEQLRASWSSEINISEVRGKIKLTQETVVKSTSMEALPTVSEMLKHCQNLFLAYAKSIFAEAASEMQEHGDGQKQPVVKKRNSKKNVKKGPTTIPMTLQQRLALNPDHSVLKEQLLSEDSKSAADSYIVTVLSPVTEETSQTQKSATTESMQKMEWERASVESSQDNN